MSFMNSFLIKTTKRAIENFVKTGKKIPIPKDCPEEYRKKMGVFVTIYKKNPKRLRGCIGFPHPQLPLIEALIEAAINSCKDPRFPPLSEYELEEITIEISVLTEPELIEVKNPKEYLEKVEIGRDGLIIRNGFYSGLLLPQVAVEHKWNAEEFLKHLCLKAGLTIDSWLDSNSRIYRFQAKIIHE